MYVYDAYFIKKNWREFIIFTYDENGKIFEIIFITLFCGALSRSRILCMSGFSIFVVAQSKKLKTAVKNKN